MAAEATHGKRGMVKWDSAELGDEYDSWNLTVTADLHDTSGMHATNTGRTKIAGLLDWVCDITGPADDSGPMYADGAKATLELWLTQTLSDGKVSGAAIMIGISQTQQQSDAGRIVYHFKGNGALTWAVA